MKVSDLKEFYMTGKMTCPRPVCLAVTPSPVAPTPKDQMAHVEVPLPAKDESFNQVPVSEMEHLHQFKGMDDLHRSDKMAREYHRGTGLKQYLKENGVDKFKSHYKN